MTRNRSNCYIEGMYTLRISPHPHLDAWWYGRLLEATPDLREAFIMLEPDQQTLAQVKDMFFAGRAKDEQINPDFHPHHLDSAAIRRAKAELTRLQQDIETQEKMPTSNQHI
jgi:hypothetical protein